MQLLMQSYDPIEMQRVRAELAQRRITVHISDEFTYAIPGMPGAEQPRGIWVSDEDLLPARRVVADLLGEDRVASDNSQAIPGLMSAKPDDPAQGSGKTTKQLPTSRLTLILIGAVILLLIVSFTR